jgi:hypothetical protein
VPPPPYFSPTSLPPCRLYQFRIPPPSGFFTLPPPTEFTPSFQKALETLFDDESSSGASPPP